jgi:hypothetical protein
MFGYICAIFWEGHDATYLKPNAIAELLFIGFLVYSSFVFDAD